MLVTKSFISQMFDEFDVGRPRTSPPVFHISQMRDQFDVGRPKQKPLPQHSKNPPLLHIGRRSLVDRDLHQRKYRVGRLEGCVGAGNAGRTSFAESVQIGVGR